jgi:MFS family permease
VATFIIGIGYAGFLYLGSSHSLTQEADAVKKKQAGQVKVDRAVFKRILAIVFFSTALGGLIFQSTTFALPKVIDEVLGDTAVSASAVGWYAFVVFAAASVGQLIVGFLVDRWSLKWVFLVVAAFQVLFFWVMIGLSGLLALSVAVAFMLVVFGQIPINDVLIGRVTRSEWRSRVFAARYLITFSVSATAVPMIAWIHAGWGFDSLFALLAVVAAMIVFAVVLLPRALAPAA